MRTKFPGKCFRCDRDVAAGEGFFQRGGSKWLIKLGKNKSINQWELAYWEEGHEDETRFEIITADTEADARAKMLIYLLENKLITL